MYAYMYVTTYMLSTSPSKVMASGCSVNLFPCCKLSRKSSVSNPSTLTSLKTKNRSHIPDENY
ncbi:hypothetical protein Hanom_Chr12g01110021 [Helianthus anomalus]